MKIELENLTHDQIENIKNQIARYEVENQKPEEKIDYFDGWVILPNGLEKTSNVNEYNVKMCYSLDLYRESRDDILKLHCKKITEHRLKEWRKLCKEKIDWNNTEQKNIMFMFQMKN